MLMDSITYLETKLIRAHVLSDTLIENGETLTVARVEPRTAQPASQPANASPAAPIENGETLTVARVEPRTAQPASQPATETTAAPAAGMAAEKQPESTEAPDAETEKVGKTSRQPPADAERQEPVSVASRTTAEKTQPAGAARDAEKTTEARTATPGPTQRQPESTTAAAVTSPDAGQTGEWVINLASLRSPRQAENFKSKAGMKGFDTSIQQVTVKGRDYWRVQITGLATLDEANARGNAIKQRLGLKEVWISRQR
jgi:cell division protein FtsN